jgi:hypothetical protein
MAAESEPVPLPRSTIDTVRKIGLALPCVEREPGQDKSTKWAPTLDATAPLG